MMRGDFAGAAVLIVIGAVLVAFLFGFLDEDEFADHPVDLDAEYEDWIPYDVASIKSITGPAEISYGMIHATGTGRVTVEGQDGSVYIIRVNPAHADLILMNGQSNAAYYKQYGNANFDTDDLAVTPAPALGKAFYFGYADGMPFLAGDTLNGCEIRDFIDPATGMPRVADKGPEFCRTYTEATGKKALWVSLGVPGREIKYWLPEPTDGTTNYCWIADLNRMSAFNARLDRTNFVIDKAVVIWAQGESDYTARTPESAYKERFAALHGAAPGAWGHKIDAWYLVCGFSAKCGYINTVLQEIAASNPDIYLAVGPEIPDTFTLDNGLMANDGLKVHYTQKGDNAMANAMARYITGIGGTAPAYLIQATMSASVGSSATAPDAAVCYRTNGTQTAAACTWEREPTTTTAGTTKIWGIAEGAEPILKFAPRPMLIVTVIK